MVTAYVEEHTHISLDLASQMTGLHPAILRKLVRDGVIDGEAPHRYKQIYGTCNIEQAKAVAARLQAARAPVDGNPILATEAAEKYGFPHITIYNWLNNGWVRVLVESGKRDRLLDEGDIAFAAALARESGHRQGKPVFPHGKGPYAK
jgi:hypothetical protein